jgi:hypothetical protein
MVEHNPPTSTHSPCRPVNPSQSRFTFLGNISTSSMTEDSPTVNSRSVGRDSSL